MHLKKKTTKQKTNRRKLCVKYWIFALQIWLNQKRSQGTQQNVTIPLLSIVVSFSLIYYYLFYGNAIFIILSQQILDDKLLLILK